MKNDWFLLYCNMTEDERYLYEEFSMEDNCKMDLKTYKRMYDAVELMSLDYSQQIVALPQNINISDEIALVFDDEVVSVMDNMKTSGMITLQNIEVIKKIQNRLTKMSKAENKNLWTLEALKYSKEWQECRMDARVLLMSLTKL